MTEIHLKLYNFSELEEQVAQRQDYKKNFTGHFKEKLD